jgi:hypothetical protein
VRGSPKAHRRAFLGGLSKSLPSHFLRKPLIKGELALLATGRFRMSDFPPPRPKKAAWLMELLPPSAAIPPGRGSTWPRHSAFGRLALILPRGGRPLLPSSFPRPLPAAVASCRRARPLRRIPALPPQAEGRGDRPAAAASPGRTCARVCDGRRRSWLSRLPGVNQGATRPPSTVNAVTLAQNRQRVT